tara:strand:- start:2338 stop:3345 length:1008 start_codon:yes stop_codon:yes gene_type:complete
MKMYRRLSLVALCSVALSSASFNAYAEIGKVLFANGNVRILGLNGESRPAKRGDIVKAGERLVTGAGAMGQVKMNDGGRIGLREVSRVRFEAKAGNQQPMTLVGGAVRVLNVKAGPGTPPKILLKTKDAQMDLERGDALAALTKGPEAAGAPETVVKLNRGQAIAKLGQGQERVLKVREAIAMKKQEGVPTSSARVAVLSRLAKFEGPVPTKNAPGRGTKRSALTTPMTGPQKGSRKAARSVALKPVKVRQVPLGKTTNKGGGTKLVVMKATKPVLVKPIGGGPPKVKRRVLTNKGGGTVKPIAVIKPIKVKPVVKQPPPKILSKKNKRLLRLKK